MPADPSFDPINPMVDRNTDVDKYGCYNRPRPVYSQPVVFKSVEWPYRFSTECRYDRSETDNRCQGCQHVAPVSSWHKEK